VIQSGSNGWLIPPDETSSLQQTLLHVLADATRREVVGRCARDTILKNYALPVVAKRLTELYARLLTIAQPS
jgi:glycosyltransferase involved in cell wall biosynthesis